MLRKRFSRSGAEVDGAAVVLLLSLRQSDLPDETFDQLEQGRGSEYTLEVLNGRSQKETNGFVDTFCALLSVRHQVDLFADEALLARWMQRHIRRGLKEIQATWRESHDFHEFLFQEFFSNQPGDLVAEVSVQSGLAPVPTELGFNAEIIHQHDGPRVTRHTVRLADAEDFGVRNVVWMIWRLRWA